MGLVTPATIEFRIDLQELWRVGYSWDEILPKESQMKWMKNVQVLNQLRKFGFSTGFAMEIRKPMVQPYFSDGNSQVVVIFLLIIHQMSIGLNESRG